MQLACCNISILVKEPVGYVLKGRVFEFGNVWHVLSWILVPLRHFLVSSISRAAGLGAYGLGGYGLVRL